MAKPGDESTPKIYHDSETIVTETIFNTKMCHSYIVQAHRLLGNLSYLGSIKVC